MENRPLAEASAPPGNNGSTRRKRRNGVDPVLRYFLPKPGSSPDSLELGQEVASEGEALIQSFKSSQPFYTLVAWKAVPEVNGGGSPVIVKQAVTRN
jgi:hypothetical protein